MLYGPNGCVGGRDLADSTKFADEDMPFGKVGTEFPFLAEKKEKMQANMLKGSDRRTFALI